LNYTTAKLDDGFWLSFQIHGDGSELLEYGLPTPTYYERANNASYRVYWLIDGYLHTKKGRDYLNDLVSRFSGAFRIANRLQSPPHPRYGDRSAKTCNLKQFGGLPSLRNNREVKELHSSKYDDNVFWSIKLEAIMRIRINGWLDRSSLEEWASDVFLVGEHVKDKSTLRAKCRNVYEWYKARNWRIDERISTMSRVQGAAKATAIRQAKVKGKIQTAINVLKLYGSKITVRALAEEAGISTATAQKYLKEIKASGGLGESPSEEQSDGDLLTQSPDEEEVNRGLDTPELRELTPSTQGKKEKSKAEYKAFIARKAKEAEENLRLSKIPNRSIYSLGVLRRNSS